MNYREGYGLFAFNGILFNHESPRRGETFVTRKITRAVAHIKQGLQEKLYLGNLEARRDWGYAPDYVRSHVADAAAGRARRLRDRHRRGPHGARIRRAGLCHAGLDWREYVRVDPRYFRPAEVDYLCADACKAAQSPGLAAEGRLRRAGAHHGGCGHEGGRGPSQEARLAAERGTPRRRRSAMHDRACRRSASW